MCVQAHKQSVQISGSIKPFPLSEQAGDELNHQELVFAKISIAVVSVRVIFLLTSTLIVVPADFGQFS